MKFNCAKHGDITGVIVNGYTIGCFTENFNSRDLEGTEFLIEPKENNKLTSENVSIVEKKNHLEKFKNVKEQVAKVFYEYDAIYLGVMCYKCGSAENVQIIKQSA